MGIRVMIVLLTAIGLGLVGVALGLIYMDFITQDRARVELEYKGAHADDDEVQAMLVAWDVDDRVWTALATGSLGAACTGAGGVLLIMQHPWFTRSREETAHAHG